MTEAKNLPDELARREPALFEAEAVSSHPGDLISPMASAPPTSLTNFRPKAGRGFTTHMLIFFLIGLLTFAVGAAIAVALVTGILDSHTGQLKELMHQMKDLVHASHGP
jgi:hypothetical protein